MKRIIDHKLVGFIPGAILAQHLKANQCSPSHQKAKEKKPYDDMS